jgi:hypothetical protein
MNGFQSWEDLEETGDDVIETLGNEAPLSDDIRETDYDGDSE